MLESEESTSAPGDPAEQAGNPALDPMPLGETDPGETPGDRPYTTRRGRAVAITPYDFRRPVQLSKGFFRNLSMVSESFAKLLALSLSGYLHIPVSIKTKGIRQIIFEEHTRTIANPSFINVLSLAPIKIPGMLELDLPLAFAMIEKLLGSHAISTDLRREFTAIELRIARRIVQRILNDLREAMLRLVKVEVSLTSVEHNPDFTFIMSANDPCILMEFEVELGEHKGPMSLCISLVALDAEIGSKGFSPYRDMRSESERTDDALKLRDILDITSTEVVVELGRRCITLEELEALREGDCLSLRRQVDAPLTVVVGGSPVFQARMGRCKRKAAVKITRVLESREIEQLGSSPRH